MASLCRSLQSTVRAARLLLPIPSSSSAIHVTFSPKISLSSYTFSSTQNRSLYYFHRKNYFMADSESLPAAGVSTEAHSGEDSDKGAVFPLSSSTILKIVKGDITRWFVDGSSDAIVNPANERMLGGGGADGAIHRAAGPELRYACYKVPEVEPGIRCPTGEARITPGFKLPASHVIHTVGPIYDTDDNPEASLKNAYRNSLTLAKENNIKYIAFPAISCGVYGYPYEEAASVSISTIREFSDDLKEVHFVIFLDEILDAWLKKAKELLSP